MASRLDAPVLGAFDELSGSAQKWQASISWRYQKSDRHFRGIHEEKNRAEEESEVINTMHLADIGLRYMFSNQSSISVSIPYLMATRSHPIRDASREVVGRSLLNSRGLGDITVVGRRLLWEPTAERRGNLTIGLGVKLPTGANNVVDTREREVDGERVFSVETVDQSVQPGDGGFGFILDFSGYRRMGSRMALYASGAYLINPEGTSGVKTYRSAPGEDVMSIADQYVFRTGVVTSFAQDYSVGIGGRFEGVPVHDLFGSSKGFRRPGYAVSVEPTFSWAHGYHTFSLAVPIAVQRNRQKSVPDLANGRHGDAAFADYVVMLSYGRRF